MSGPGIILVDHGSRRDESNRMLLDVVELFMRETGHTIVEPAHMELAEPSLGTAFERCVERGAIQVVVHPFFLFPGRHWKEDIPRLTAEAAQRHPSVTYLVTAPLGVDALIVRLAQLRISQCLEVARGERRDCPFCPPSSGCRFQGSVVATP